MQRFCSLLGRLRGARCLQLSWCKAASSTQPHIIDGENAVLGWLVGEGGILRAGRPDEAVIDHPCCNEPVSQCLPGYAMPLDTCPLCDLPELWGVRQQEVSKQWTCRISLSDCTSGYAVTAGRGLSWSRVQQIILLDGPRHCSLLYVRGLPESESPSVHALPRYNDASPAGKSSRP